MFSLKREVSYPRTKSYNYVYAVHTYILYVKPVYIIQVITHS